MNTSKLFEIISRYNQFWTTGAVDAGIARNILPSLRRQLESKEVVVLKGVRRSGKSTLMAQVIRALIEDGAAPSCILRINLEEPLFAPEYSIALLERIYRTYREKVQPDGQCRLFLDEVQNIPGWESWVRGRMETEEIKIFITGSSSQMVSREIGTKLTGRQISFDIHPLSFNEFLRFKNIAVEGEADYTVRKAFIRNMFMEYMRYGGFPEAVLKKEAADKELLLKSYFDDILYRDVAARHEIRDTDNLLNLAVYLLTNTGRITSINKLKKNFTISQDKTENYVSAILESGLLFQLKRFSFSLKQAQRAGFKPYAVDTGLRNRVAFSFSEDSGWLVENMILCHLKRIHEDVFFDADGGETDFVVKAGMKIVRRIQVWYDDPVKTDVPKRELAPFRTSDNHNKDAESILITNDYEDSIKMGSTTIHCIPAVKFLLFNRG